MDPTRLGSLVDKALADGVLTAKEQNDIIREALNGGVTVAELSDARELLRQSRNDWARASIRLVEARRELAIAQRDALSNPIRLAAAQQEAAAAEQQEDEAQRRVDAFSRIEVQMAEAVGTRRTIII